MPKKIKKRLKSSCYIEEAPRIKISEVLLDYAKPLTDDANNFEETEKALTFAVAFWNIAILPEEEQDEAIRDTLKTLEVVEDDMLEIEKSIRTFIKRKKILYPDINRFIVNHQVIDLGDRIHVDVASYDLKLSA